MRTKKPGYPVKEIIVGFKSTSDLVRILDEDAAREGLSRSAIVRRILLDIYRHRLPTREANTPINP